MIKVNSFVVFRDPNPDEVFNGNPLRFIVIELNGDRCIIEPVTSSLYYKPSTLALVSDLQDVNELPE